MVGASPLLRCRIMNKPLRWIFSVAAGACSLALLSEGSAACVLVDAVAAVGDVHLGELVAQAGALAIVP